MSEPTAMSYRGLSHVAFATGDLEATLRFWRDLLGLRLAIALGRRGDKQYFLQVADRQYIAFFEWPGVKPIEEKDAGYPVRGQVAFDHLAVAVAIEDSLWDLKDRLEAAGFWATEVIDHGFVHSLYTFDPNGIAVELCVDAGFDPSAQAALLDRDPCPAALEGSDPQPGVWPEPSEPTSADQRRRYPGFGAELKEILKQGDAGGSKKGKI